MTTPVLLVLPDISQDEIFVCIRRALTLIFNISSLDLPLTFGLITDDRLQAAAAQKHQSVLILAQPGCHAHSGGDEPEDDRNQSWSNPPAVRRETHEEQAEQAELLPKTSTDTRGDMRAAAC